METPQKPEEPTSPGTKHLEELQNLQIPTSSEKVFGSIPELQLFKDQLNHVSKATTNEELNEILRQEINKFPPGGRLSIKAPEGTEYKVVLWEQRFKPKDYRRQTKLDIPRELAIIYFPLKRLVDPERTILKRLNDISNLNHTFKSLLLDAHRKRTPDQRPDSELFVQKLLYSDLVFLNHLLQLPVISKNEEAKETIRKISDQYHKRIHDSVEQHREDPHYVAMRQIAKEATSLHNQIRPRQK